MRARGLNARAACVECLSRMGDLERRRVDSFALGDLSALNRCLLAVDIYGPDYDPAPRLLPRFRAVRHFCLRKGTPQLRSQYARRAMPPGCIWILVALTVAHLGDADPYTAQFEVLLGQGTRAFAEKNLQQAVDAFQQVPNASCDTSARAFRFTAARSSRVPIPPHQSRVCGSLRSSREIRNIEPLLCSTSASS